MTIGAAAPISEKTGQMLAEEHRGSIPLGSAKLKMPPLWGRFSFFVPGVLTSL